ncbi:MAG TPA: NAD(P)-binding domain-containing protein [Gemmatimonadales bacterium]|nr:NAD(P)-binding domain-containing protein [Gemmatimonadales bacterium]
MTAPTADRPVAPARVERVDTLIVGAGQAGLAAGYHAMRRDDDVLLLDAGSAVGQSWRDRWDSLRLFTPAAHNHLPGMPFPAPPHHRPDKDEAADYLARYADRFELPIRHDTRVTSATWHGGRFVVESSTGRYESRQLIVATGPYARPTLPAWHRELDLAITQLTTLSYRSPFALPSGPVLVVGAGNSGAQIALELARTHKVWLAGRDTGSLPRRLLGRDLFDWFGPVLRGLPIDRGLGAALRRRMAGGDALVGFGNAELAAAGVVRVPRVEGVSAGMPRAGDTVLEPSTIIWCTGLRPAHEWLPSGALDGEGRAMHRYGLSTTIPGLAYVGLRHQRRLASSLLGGVGADAGFVVQALADPALGGHG